MIQILHDKKNFSIFASGICVILIAIAFGMNAYRSISLEMHTKPSMWAINAIPYALSRLFFNQDKYLTNLKVQEVFFSGRNSVSNNFGIEESMKLDANTIGEDCTIWDIEDKGIIDFVSVAFQIFGYKSERIIYLFYFIIFLSSISYIIANFHHPKRIFLLLAFYVMLYLIQPMVSLNEQLTNLVAPRVLPILAIISSLHCIYFAFSPQKKLYQILLLSLQIPILIFVLHVRIVTFWQVFGVIATSTVSCISYVISKKYFGHYKFYINELLFRSLPLILILLGLLHLSFYRQTMIPKIYMDSGQPQTRLVWHNILSGLAFEPSLAEKYKLKIDDGSEIDMVIDYLEKSGRHQQVIDLNAGGGDHVYPFMRWKLYDEFAKEVLIETCSLYPQKCLKALLYYKPISLIKNLGWAYGLRSTPADLDLYVSNFPTNGDFLKVKTLETSRKLDEKRQRVYLWTPFALILLSIPFIIIRLIPYDSTCIKAMFVLCVFSFMPSVLAYPGIHTIIDVIIVVGMFIYIIFCLSLYKLYDLINIRSRIYANNQY